jgi:hypothetical protein
VIYPVLLAGGILSTAPITLCLLPPMLVLQMGFCALR